MDIVFSPLDRRYKENIPPVLSEESSFSFQLDIEAEWLKTLRDEKICPHFEDSDLARALVNVSFSRVEEIEKRTQHATRALVEAISEALTTAGLAEIGNWVHVGLTSFDVVDTASRLRLKAYMQDEFFPLIEKIQDQLSDLAHKHADTLQAGRTHGQWAVPTNFGLSVAEAFARIRDLVTEAKFFCDNLRGQSSGAVGGYHASALLAEDPLELEKKFLSKLGLKPHFGSTQILPPEDIASVAHSILLISAVITKVANDWRHLARSEIGEIFEAIGEGQVGSSTMPQKRNPWNLEHICSLYKVLRSKFFLIEEDLVTEHQRDLTNSASGRFYFEFFSVAHLLLARFAKVSKTIGVDEKKMLDNFEQAGSSVFAEALYILLTQKGAAQAHDIVREAARTAERTGQDLLAVLQSEKHIESRITTEKLTKQVLAGSSAKLKAIFANR